MQAIASRRRIDHLVLPARDLAAQAAFFSRLGFTVGGRNRHPWGTENHIVQFDGTFLELITVGADAAIPSHAPCSFSFGQHVSDTLAAGREGLSMLVLDSADSAADAHWFTQSGIGGFEPFFFERKGMRPDGTPVHVAFTLAFAKSEAMPEPAFFVCQHHFPEAFWNPDMQRHTNGVTGVQSLTLVTPQPEAAAAFLGRFAGGAKERLPDGVRHPAASAGVDILSAQAATARFGADPVFERQSAGHFAAITFAVQDIAALLDGLAEAGIPHRQEAALVVVPSGEAFGVLLAFAGAGD